MRIFIGIKIDAPPEVSQIKCELGHAHSKWVKESNYHLTLVFIGQAKTADKVKISQALHKIVPQHAPFVISLKGAGSFQKRRSSGVLWLGVEDSTALKALHNEVNNAVLHIFPNLKNQYKDYTPHITVARIKDREELSAFKQRLNELNVSRRQRVDEVFLYESLSTPNGVEYKVLERFNLK
ncbi:2'-5' RNA ligase [Saccharicrinis carchari]|uniref:RNA 2',3'-cyclic phosphodiesterase n=1 Tax=Saccharicrinis carchari TaxID=1168039 RepID=A0A521B7Y2_SACCC|nr:RNA 2',3'-cyclic phosphodiesterase [Saccharicrinis carchari]SMO43204.1 2'-5' RNA ligase [Saccharicrinis carchari]